MLRTFSHKGLRAFWESGSKAKLPVGNAARVSRMLRALNAAERPEDLNLPGYRFHRLTGDRRGRYSITVSGNWRITFGWDGNDATAIDIEDYH